MPAPARRTNLGFSEFWVSGGSGRPLSGIPRPDWGNIPRRGANFIFSKGSVGFISSASYFLACIGDGLPSGRGKFCPDSDRVPIFPGLGGDGGGRCEARRVGGRQPGGLGLDSSHRIGVVGGGGSGAGSYPHPAGDLENASPFWRVPRSGGDCRSLRHRHRAPALGC